LKSSRLGKNGQKDQLRCCSHFSVVQNNEAYSSDSDLQLVKV
ncbi:hypothetical protein TNIN_284241, partial [Trichonephila inaurata madagascariensis]